MGPFEKYVKVFHPIYLFYTLSILLYHLPYVIHKNKLWNERKEELKNIKKVAL